MKLRFRLGWLALLAFPALSATGQENLLPVSRTAAALTVQIPPAKTTLVALPTVIIVASGTVSAVAGNNLTLASSPSVLPALTGPHAIKITSRSDQRGAGATAPAGSSTNAYGYSAPISAVAGQMVTAALTSVPNAGDEFVIYQTSTIGSVLGANNSAGLTAGATADAADIVYVGSAGALVGYFYNSAASEWRLVSNPGGASQAGVEVGQTGGLLIARKAGGAAVSLKLTGQLLPGRTVASVTGGFQVINNPYSVPTTLAASGLQGFVTGGTSAALADILYLEQGGVLTGYYYKTAGLGGTGWRTLADNLTNQGAALVAPGKAILFKEQAGTSGLVMQEPFAE